MYIPSDGTAENLDLQCVYTVEAILPDLTKIIRLADPLLKKSGPGLHSAHCTRLFRMSFFKFIKLCIFDYLNYTKFLNHLPVCIP
jgi:hypothetical protein